jgi:hypothetical protein
MSEKSKSFTFEQRCHMADLRIRTAIIEALPEMKPFERGLLLVALHQQLYNKEEVLFYASEEGHGDLVADTLLGVKAMSIVIGYEPNIAATIDIEKGGPVVGYIEGNSVH